MKLENINKDFIKVTSPSLIDNRVTALELAVTINCCTTIYTDVVTFATPTVWKLELASGILTEVLFKNIYSGIETNVITAPFNIPTEINNLVIELQNNLNALFNFTPDYITVSYDATTSILSITELPNTIVMDKMKYNTGDSILFYSNTSENGNFISGDALYITPELFNLEEMKDGVYQIEISYFDNNGIPMGTDLSNIYFDNKIQCMLAQYLDKIVKDKSDTNLHMIHYSLSKGTNCSCNYSEMCKLFEFLWNSLLNSNPLSNCGCN